MIPTHAQPLISVVTPVYNGAKHLDEAIKSVLTQTYTNWEYIIVNNCSRDGTREIAEHYAWQDPRVRVHNNETFVAALPNHHLAFQQMSAESKYCKVLHADDWLFPECLMQMVEVAETHPSVGVVSAYRLDGEWVNLDGLPYPSTFVLGREICRTTLLGGPYVFGSPSSLLIRADLIRKRPIFYDADRFPFHADFAACFEVLQESDFGFAHQVLTYTRRHSEARTSVAQQLNTYLIEDLEMLKKYGSVYLSQKENEQRFQQKMKRYYKFLGQNFLRRDKQFWDYHKSALQRLGLPLISTTFLGAFSLYALSVFLRAPRYLWRMTSEAWTPVPKRAS